MLQGKNGFVSRVSAPQIVRLVKTLNVRLRESSVTLVDKP
jgi:hypothetical protein